MQNGRGWGGLAPSLENEKKEAVRGNFNLFPHCFTNKIRWGGIDIHYIYSKWKGVGGQALVHGGGGVLPPLENEKKRLSVAPSYGT